jgi:hypothetical protein
MDAHALAEVKIVDGLGHGFYLVREEKDHGLPVHAAIDLRMGFDHGAGDDSKVVASPLHAPEEIRVLRLGDGNGPALGGDHAQGDDVIDGHAIVGLEATEASAKHCTARTDGVAVPDDCALGQKSAPWGSDREGERKKKKKKRLTHQHGLRSRRPPR